MNIGYITLQNIWWWWWWWWWYKLFSFSWWYAPEIRGTNV